MAKLSPNFSFEELTTTSHSDLLEANREEAKAHIEDGKLLANYVLQPIRDLVGIPMITNSGFRGPTLNARVGGSSRSQHMKFQAWDGNFKGFESNDGRLIMIGYIMALSDSGLVKFGQCLIERGCIHLSLTRGNGRDGEVAYYDVATKTKKIIREGR